MIVSNIWEPMKNTTITTADVAPIDPSKIQPATTIYMDATAVDFVITTGTLDGRMKVNIDDKRKKVLLAKEGIWELWACQDVNIGKDKDKYYWYFALYMKDIERLVYHDIEILLDVAMRTFGRYHGKEELVKLAKDVLTNPSTKMVQALICPGQYERPWERDVDADK